MKNISNHLGAVLLTICAVIVCIGVISMSAPSLSAFFGDVITTNAEKTQLLLNSIENPSLLYEDGSADEPSDNPTEDPNDGTGTEPGGEVESGEAYALIFENNADSANAMPMIIVLEEEAVAAGETYNSEVYGEITVKYALTNFEDKWSVPWEPYRSNITSVVVEDAVAPISTNAWFMSFSKCIAMNLSKLDTSRCTDMQGMFSGCSSLTEIDVSTFKTENVTSMASMFYKCSQLTNLDLSSFDTKNVQDMSGMFWLSSKLVSLDLSGFDTSSLTMMYNLFHTCSSLQSITFGEKWDVDAVDDMSYVFYKCATLKEIDISSWNTAAATNMGRMFGECTALTSIKFGDGWNTSNVTTMTQMFYKDGKLSLDCSGWNVSKVTSKSSFNTSASGVKAPTWAS